MKKKIKALYKSMDCTGVIEILSRSSNTAYVNWSFYDQKDKFIASFTNDYFFENGTPENEEIFHRVINQITKYRIGREKPFSNIKLEE